MTALATEAIPESDEHFDSSIEKASVVATIDQFGRETLLECRTNLCKLWSWTHDTRLRRFHPHLGDYAGDLLKLLIIEEWWKSFFLSAIWTMIVKTLDDYKEWIASWKTSGCKGLETSSPERDGLKVRVQEIIDAGFTDLKPGLAKVFSRRARTAPACYSRSFSL